MKKQVISESDIAAVVARFDSGNAAAVGFRCVDEAGIGECAAAATGKNAVSGVF